MVLISGFITAVIAVAIGFLIFNSSSQQAMQKTADDSANTSVSRQANNSTNDKPAGNESQPGKYIDYSPGALASANGTKLIFFHASWCPQCRSLEADIKARGVPKGVTILKADYDTNRPLRQKYGVIIQTTVVRVDDKGNLIKKYVAYDRPTLTAVTANLL